MSYKIPLFDLNFDNTEAEAVVKTLESKWISMGKQCQDFEEKFASMSQAKHAVALSSCTAALHLALMALEIGAEDEVLVPSLTLSEDSFTLALMCTLSSTSPAIFILSSKGTALAVSMLNVRAKRAVFTPLTTLPMAGTVNSLLCTRILNVARFINCMKANTNNTITIKIAKPWFCKNSLVAIKN